MATHQKIKMQYKLQIFLRAQVGLVAVLTNPYPETQVEHIPFVHTEQLVGHAAELMKNAKV